MALFHDTKSITHQTIGSLIDVANCLDLRFIKPNDLFLKSDLLENGILLGEESNLRNGISFAQVNQNEKVDYTPITYSKDQIPHVDHILNSNTKLCISTYTNKTYGQCEGVDSICFNGNWYSKNDVIIKKGCQR